MTPLASIISLVLLQLQNVGRLNVEIFVSFKMFFVIGLKAKKGFLSLAGTVRRTPGAITEQ